MKSNIIKKLNSFQELGIFIVLIVMCTIISLVNPVFLSYNNLINIFRTTSYVLIVAVAQTFLFTVGGLDLSIGSVIGISGMISAIFLNTFQMPVIIAVLAGLLTGVIFGLINATLIVKGKIPPLITTLGTMYIARGLMNVLTQGKPIYPLPDGFNAIGNGMILGIPYSVIIAVVLVIIGYLVLRFTIFGRYIFAIGGNQETAKLSGINVDMIRMTVYVLIALLASVTGIILTARMGSAQVSTGTGWEMTIIAAVIIGGTSMFGGLGTILGTVLGALLMSVLTSGMVLMRISAFWQNVAIGAIIILAVAIDQIKRRRSGDIV